MAFEKAVPVLWYAVLIDKVKDVGILMKFKLSLTVVFSAIMAYLIALKTPVDINNIIILFTGGLLTSGAASALNQAIEKDYDKLMSRTANRPVAAGRMTMSNAVLVAGIMSLIGISLLSLFNPLTGFLGMISLISYAFVYTPLKRVSNIAVLWGGIPGALPVIIGCTAAQNGTFSMLAIILFAIQFFWQFPHFWAIAWLANEDYKKAGFNLLPNKEGICDAGVGKQSMIFSLMLIPFSILPFWIGAAGKISMIALVILAIVYAYFGWNLHKECSRKAALKLMFMALIYLPTVLIILYFDKI